MHVNAALAMSIRNGKSVTVLSTLLTHDIDANANGDVDNDVRGPD